MKRVLVLALALGPLAAHAGTGSDTLRIAFVKYTLANGFEVILAPDHRVPVVHVNLVYHVGSKDDPAHRTGFAHLFEHMMFQGSRDLAEDTWFQKLEAIGG